MQGSNPIWMKAYANEWFKNDDDLDIGPSNDALVNNLHQTHNHHHRLHVNSEMLGGSGFDSLDENALSAESYTGPLGKDVDNFRSTGGGPFNVYQQIDRMTGSVQALTKKLETTEL